MSHSICVMDLLIKTENSPKPKAANHSLKKHDIINNKRVSPALSYSLRVLQSLSLQLCEEVLVLFRRFPKVPQELTHKNQNNKNKSKNNNTFHYQ